ncbi:MAG: bacteriohemerythrin [Acidobacteria bacterium]|nr:bacteriohemerythrin [Acidobacteriota bacterium]
MPTCEAVSLVTWSDRYSVGIARIDLEHKKLIGMVNELYAAMISQKDAPVLGIILANLAAYTVSHFATEEELMKRHAYPASIQHKAEHDGLVAKVKQLQQEHRAGRQAVSKDVMIFLQQWLLSHILGSDKKYVTHLKAAGVK